MPPEPEADCLLPEDESEPEPDDPEDPDDPEPDWRLAPPLSSFLWL
jgi:hypothetical protein